MNQLKIQENRLDSFRETEESPQVMLDRYAAKILVIDDDRGFLRQIQRELENKSYQVITAENAEEGFNKIENEKPDLILLDVVLPFLSGYELCMELKTNSNFGIPILMLTASNTKNSIDFAFRCGANGFIAKNVYSDRLIKEIEKFV